MSPRPVERGRGGGWWGGGVVGGWGGGSGGRSRHSPVASRALFSGSFCLCFAQPPMGDRPRQHAAQLGSRAPAAAPRQQTAPCHAAPPPATSTLFCPCPPRHMPQRLRKHRVSITTHTPQPTQQLENTTTVSAQHSTAQHSTAHPRAPRWWWAARASSPPASGSRSSPAPRMVEPMLYQAASTLLQGALRACAPTLGPPLSPGPGGRRSQRALESGAQLRRPQTPLH